MVFPRGRHDKVAGFLRRLVLVRAAALKLGTSPTFPRTPEGIDHASLCPRRGQQCRVGALTDRLTTDSRSADLQAGWLEIWTGRHYAATTKRRILVCT